MLADSLSSSPPMQKKWHFTCDSPSLLKKTAHIVLPFLLGACVLIGTLNYFHLNNPYFFYGTIGVGGASLITLIISCIEKRSTAQRVTAESTDRVTTPSNPDALVVNGFSLKQKLSKDILVFSAGMERHQAFCETAIQKIASSKFKKIAICLVPKDQAPNFFNEGGILRHWEFENYTPVLMICMAEEMETVKRINGDLYFKCTANIQRGRLKDFETRKHAWISMTQDDYHDLINHQKFSQRIHKIITG